MYQAFIVTSCGYYPVLQNSVPQESKDILESLVEIVKSMRPGAGRTYETSIVEVTDSSTPTSASRVILESISSSIFERNTNEHALHHRL